MLKEKKDGLRQFGQKLYSMRKGRRMTQIQLADELGVDYRQISRYETGEAEMGAMLYDKILDVCGQKPQGETADLLQVFGNLTPENKTQLIGLAKMMERAQKN